MNTTKGANSPTKPTAKLPRARVMKAQANRTGAILEVLYSGHTSRMAYQGGDTFNPVAVIPTHTAAQARAICKAAPFLQLSEEEQMVRIRNAIFYELGGGYSQARAVLRAMNLGGGK